MGTLIRLVLIIGFLQIKCFAFAQTSSHETSRYVFAFNPVYASNLIDIGYVAFEDLYLVVSDAPLKIDSVMSILSKKSYSSMPGILDTLRQEFNVYNLVENDSKSKNVNRINHTLTDCSHFGSGYLFYLNDTIKKSSALVGFVIRRFTFFDKDIKYKVLNDKCNDFPNECRAIITKL
jgi:hypothetical protein